MTTISDLSGDLVEEILSRVPLISLRAVRSTCKRWNTLSKNLILGEKASRNNHQFLEFMVVDFRVSSLRFDLQGIHNEDKLVDPSMKQISIPNNDEIKIFQCQVYHCDGLLLCVTQDDNSKLLVWNPYLGQTIWIPPRNQFNKFDRFAIGYDMNRNHKILRFCYDCTHYSNRFEMYDFSSDCWRVLYEYPKCDGIVHKTGVSLKGNTYFIFEEFQGSKAYIICFDFTTEMFGPPLPLPLNPPYASFDAVVLSWVRDEKLAVLYNHYKTPQIIEILISTKIEPDAVSWSTFLTIDTSQIIGVPEQFEPTSFFVDEEKKVIVLFATDIFQVSETRGCQMAYIFGEEGYFKSINIGRFPNLDWTSGELVRSSYVPSLVQLQV